MPHLPDLPQTPGDAIQAELDNRGWTQAELADRIGRYRPEISAVVTGKRGISTELAVALAAVFGDDPERWLLIQARHELASMPSSAARIVGERAKLYSIAPVREMERRGWIEPSKDVDDLRTKLLRFFGASDLDDIPPISVATRRTPTSAIELSPAQRAWCFRARQLATIISVPPYQASKIAIAERKLRELAAFPKEARHLPLTLGEFGIRFVVVEPLPSAKIDGAVFWMDESSPVIAVSLRFDRNDSFWFTVMHEFAHIKHGDAISVDWDHSGDDFRPSITKETAERRADESASQALIPSDELESFIRRVGPLYSKDRIVQFAHRVKMHPGVIVGQLHHRGEIGYSANREMLVKIRDVVTSTAVTDGYGHQVSPTMLAENSQ